MHYRDLWAKSDPFHPLWCHLLDAAAVCKALLPRFGGVPPIPDNWVLFIVALHDLGKADEMFQFKAPDLAQRLVDGGCKAPITLEKFRHEARSADWLQSYLRRQTGWGLNAAKVVQQAVRGHHGDFAACARDESELPLCRGQWDPLRTDLVDMLLATLDIDAWEARAFDEASVVGVRLSGLIVLSDWIASNHEVYHYPDLTRVAGPDVTPQQYFAAACAEATKAIRRLELSDRPSMPPPAAPLRFKDVWDVPSLRPSQIALERQVCSEGISPGLVIIEAPMGEGKTEGALYVARHWEVTSGRSGIYFALPTAATSNQMRGRYAEYLQKRGAAGPAPRLVHGMAWLVDEASPDAASQTFGEDTERSLSREWFQNAKRALLATEGVGTVDQALMSALNVKHGFLRLLGLSPKTLIIDEVHAYDVYMTTIMECLLKWCRALRIPVVLLSATLTFAQKRRLAEAYGGRDVLPVPDGGGEPYPLLTFVPIDGEARSVTVEHDPVRDRIYRLKSHSGLLGNATATAQLALETVKDGGCACVLANTVGSGQAVFKELQDANIPDLDLHLFHARFRACRRQEIERTVVGLFGKDAGAGSNPPRPGRAILVATQVVEQSLDVDFDVMISEIAPIDLLLQRLGRVHRHERGARPTGADAVLHVLLPADTGTPDFDGTGYVYEVETLLRTLAILDGRSAIRLPEDFRPLIEQAYAGAPVESELFSAEMLEEAARKRQNRQGDSENQARTHLIPDPSPRVFQLAQNAGAVDEGDEGRAGYFHARTRQGEDTRSILLLRDPVLVELCRKEKFPGRRQLQRLMLESVNLPAWWFTKTTAADGFELPFGAPWLRGSAVLPLRGDRWEGWKSTRGGKAWRVMIDDCANSRDRRYARGVLWIEEKGGE